MCRSEFLDEADFDELLHGNLHACNPGSRVFSHPHEDVENSQLEDLRPDITPPASLCRRKAELLLTHDVDRLISVSFIEMSESRDAGIIEVCDAVDGKAPVIEVPRLRLARASVAEIAIAVCIHRGGSALCVLFGLLVPLEAHMLFLVASCSDDVLSHFVVYSTPKITSNDLLIVSMSSSDAIAVCEAVQLGDAELVFLANSRVADGTNL